MIRRYTGHRTDPRFRALCEKSGFAENFDALTGEGLRDRAYTWTAAGYLLLADDHHRRASGAPSGLPTAADRGDAASGPGL